MHRIALVCLLAFVALLARPAAGVTLLDSWLAAETELALFGDPHVRGAHVGAIAVTVAGGVVTLQGRVATDASRAEAERAVSAVNGVAGVRNELIVDRRDRLAPLVDDVITRWVEQALRTDHHLRGATIAGTVRDGVVTLSGTIPDVMTRAEASRVARRVAGVRAVQNDLFPTALQLASR